MVVYPARRELVQRKRVIEELGYWVRIIRRRGWSEGRSLLRTHFCLLLYHTFAQLMGYD